MILGVTQKLLCNVCVTGRMILGVTQKLLCNVCVTGRMILGVTQKLLCNVCVTGRMILGVTQRSRSCCVTLCYCYWQDEFGYNTETQKLLCNVCYCLLAGRVWVQHRDAEAVV